MQMKEKFINPEFIDISSELTNEQAENYTTLASKYDAIIFGIFVKVKYGTGKIALPISQINLLKSLSGNISNTIVISFGNPYLLKEFSSIPNYMCAYGDADVSIKAAIKAIQGEIHIIGKLPVSITNEYKLGSRIQK